MVRKITKHHSEEKHDGKKIKSHVISHGKQMESRSLPFAVDITNRTVEYKDDTLSIILSKAKEVPTQKAQPRKIPVVDKNEK
jgi:HSP20 family molecular chaperone IbpA